jgi:hypothetical protein
VIGSDVWEFGAFFRDLGLPNSHRHARRIYPSHYLNSVHGADVLVQPNIPIQAYVPGGVSVEKLIAAGERAAYQALSQ